MHSFIVVNEMAERNPAVMNTTQKELLFAPAPVAQRVEPSTKDKNIGGSTRNKGFRTHPQKVGSLLYSR